jgi:hypothetical protein
MTGRLPRFQTNKEYNFAGSGEPIMVHPGKRSINSGLIL